MTSPSSHGPMVEIYVNTPLSVCAHRAPKGPSKKGPKGLIAQYTGIDDPNEAPSDLELNVDTVEKTPAEPAKQILDHLAAAGLLSGGGG